MRQVTTTHRPKAVSLQNERKKITLKGPFCVTTGQLDDGRSARLSVHQGVGLFCELIARLDSRSDLPHDIPGRRLHVLPFKDLKLACERAIAEDICDPSRDVPSTQIPVGMSQVETVKRRDEFT